MTDRDFDNLVTRYLDGQLTPADHAAFTESLRGCADRQRAFVELALTRRTLHEAVGAPRATRRQSPTMPKVVTRRGSGSAFRWTLAAAAALLFAAGAAAIYALVFSVDVDPTEARGPVVATLIDASEAAFVNDDYATTGTEYAAGMYAIQSGTAELLLTNRVAVELEGTTRLHLHSPGRASLQRGVARFVVPEEAVGFTVLLPDNSKIVDLGTAFRVEVDDADAAQLRVTEGRVAWTPSSADAETVIVTAGRSAQIVDGRVVLSDTPLFEDSFERPDAVSNVIGKRFVHAPPGWIGTTTAAGYGWDKRGRVNEADSGFTTPFGDNAYAIRYTNAAITTAPDTITEPLTAGFTYTISFHAASLLAEGDSTYIVELVALSAGDDRSDDEAGVILASAEGRVTPNGMAESHRVVFVAEEGHPRLGDAIAIRLRGMSKEAVAYDNIKLSIEPTTSTGSTRSATTRTPGPNEPAGRSDEPRDSEGPSSEK